MDVSILLFYNEDRGFLNDAIKSAAAQEFDGSFELIVHQGNFGVSKNINDGLKKCSGQFIKLLGEDDVMLPNCIQDLFDRAKVGFDVVCSNAINWFDSHEEIYWSSIPPTVSHLAQDYSMHGGTVLYRRQSLIDVGGFDETLQFGEEFDLHLRLASAGYRFGYVDKVVYKYRIHKNMKSMQGGFADSTKYIERKRYILHNIVFKYQDIKMKIVTLPA